MAGTSHVCRPVDFSRVKLEDAFWAPRMRINHETTLPVQYQHLLSTGRIDAIDPDYRPGDRTAHHIFWDSDVAKWMEAASYDLATHPDEERASRLDEVIARFSKLQRDDGYVNSWYIKVEPDKRWTNLRDCHELYCAGHLMEAAVAHYRATGRRTFLDVMCRYAEYIGTVFGREEGKKRGYPGHEEIELALIKLYHATGDGKYLKLARYFIDERGQRPHYYEAEAVERGEGPGEGRWNHEYNQSHLPVRDQTHAAGHAVRAMYLYSGMADIAIETGDEGLIQAGRRLWENVCLRQMYVTGGVGAAHQGERFTLDYDLPEESAYCETCAAIGLVFWNHRLLQLEGDGRYADGMERALYNGTISGISLSGDRFFYVNPLTSLGDHHREEWFGCACCPPNISRLIASIGGYIYSEGPRDAWVHLYVQGSGELDLGGCPVRLEQQTDYPWDGAVEITVRTERPVAFTLHLRIPGWCRRAKLEVNGRTMDLGKMTRKGYVQVAREWRDRDRVRLSLDMPVERIVAHPSVRMANGKVALQRGPVVYCLEDADNKVVPLSRIALSRTAQLNTAYRNDLLGGVVVITGKAEAIGKEGWESTLYRPDPAQIRPCEITAVPYCVWGNREPGGMLVWIRTCA